MEYLNRLLSIFGHDPVEVCDRHTADDKSINIFPLNTDYQPKCVYIEIVNNNTGDIDADLPGYAQIKLTVQQENQSYMAEMVPHEYPLLNLPGLFEYNKNVELAYIEALKDAKKFCDFFEEQGLQSEIKIIRDDFNDNYWSSNVAHNRMRYNQVCKRKPISSDITDYFEIQSIKEKQNLPDITQYREFVPELNDYYEEEIRYPYYEKPDYLAKRLEELESDDRRNIKHTKSGPTSLLIS